MGNSYIFGSRLKPSGYHKPESPRPKRAKELEERHASKLTHDTLNTIARGFVRGGKSSYFCRSFARQVVHVVYSLPKPESTSTPKFTFSHNNVAAILPHEDDCMVINIHIFSYGVKHILIDPDIFFNVVFRTPSKVTTRP